VSGGARSPSNDDDDPSVGSDLGQSQEVIAIARDEEAIALIRVLKNVDVGGAGGEDVTKKCYVMPQFLE